MALPFKDRLNTNYAPSGEELLEISRILLEPQAQLARMNDEIEQAQATLDGLKRLRDELVQRIDQYRALASPIRRIPQDVLREIFANCLPTNRNAIMSAREAPLLLGRVSSSWRTISLSTPRLWSTVHVAMPGGFASYVSSEVANTNYAVAMRRMAELRTAALQEWIKRSGSLPLDISFSQWEERAYAPVYVNPQESHLIVEIILSVSRRWRNITVAAPVRSIARFVTHSPNDLPFLESLAFDFSRVDSWPELSEIPEHNIYRTPSLRRLSLTHPKGDCLQLPVNWAHLTELSIEKQWVLDPGLSLDQAMDLLSRCPRLVRCRLEIRNAAVNPVQFSSLRLPNLECLSILEKADVTHMFNCLDLPALCEVEYHTAIAPDSTKKSSLLTLFRRLGGSIQKFTTNPQLFLREDFIECLRLISNTTTLTFCAPDHGAHVVRPTILDKELFYSFLPSTRNALCPKLKFLEISSRLDFSDEDLLGFILGKQKGDFPDILKLKDVRIKFLRPRTMDIVPRLTSFMEGGLNLQLIYPSRPTMALSPPSDGLPHSIWA